jgi:hypothetical protein
MRLFFVLIADGLDFTGEGSGHQACESIATLSLKNKSPSVQEKYGRFLRNERGSSAFSKRNLAVWGEKRGQRPLCG